MSGASTHAVLDKAAIMTNHTPSQPPPRLLYPALVIAAIAVTIFSLLGIAAITGYLPDVLAGPAAPPTVDNAAGAAKPADASARRTPRSRTASAKADNQAATCVDCGVVESVRVVEAQGQASGLGAVLGGVGGALVGSTLGRGSGRTAMTVIGGGAGAYAGHEIEKNNHRHLVWHMRVRMDDGTPRTLKTATEPGFAVGDKVRIVEGRAVARSAEGRTG